MKKANFISGLVLLMSSLSLLIFIIPAQIEEVTDATVSPRFMPYVCGAIILLLSLYLVLQNLPRVKRDLKKEKAPISMAEFRAMLAISGTLTLGIILFNFFGTLISSAFLVVSTMWLMGERRLLAFILLSGGLLLTTYVIFYKFLGTSIQ